MEDTPMLTKLLGLIDKTNPKRLVISAHDYVQLRTEVMAHYASVANGQQIVPPPDPKTGFAGYLYGIPLFIEPQDKLLKAAQKAVDHEEDLEPVQA